MPADHPDQPAPTSFQSSLPNLLTMARLALTAIVIICLALYNHPRHNTWARPVSAALFIIAALTDAADGYLARKWNVVSVFGRVMDPFADKVLVLGSFIMLAGTGFADINGKNVAGVEAWVPVVLLARELLVTSIRGVMEGSGVSFGANWAGKAKMILQSVAVPLILVLLWLGPREHSLDPVLWVRATMQLTVILTVLVTIASGWPYLSQALRAAKAGTGGR